MEQFKVKDEQWIENFITRCMQLLAKSKIETNFELIIEDDYECKCKICTGQG